MAASVPFAYRVDEWVVIQNLQKTPEHNGKVGMVKELLTDKQRIMVKLLEGGKLVNVKQDNMRKAESGELKEQLGQAFEKLEQSKIERILRDNGVQVQGDKSELVKAAVDKQVFPEPKKGAAATAHLDPDEELDVPGIGLMRRRDMWEQADQLERMTISQMREQIRTLTSRTPQELRAMSPQMRNLSDTDIQMQVQQLQAFVNNPQLKKQRVEALRSGDFTKMNATSIAAMDDETLRRDARVKLDMFRANPTSFREQYLKDQAELTDEDIEKMLEQQANADSKTLKQMRAAALGGNVDVSSLTDDQLKQNAELQIKMFKKDPQKMRKQLEQQNPQVKNLSDDELLFQLESLASMSAEDIRAMQKMSADGGAGLSAANAGAAQQKMEDMTGEQLQRMFRMQRDMFKRDPKNFRKMVPQMASLSDSMIQQQLDLMADMSPDNLKMYISTTSRFSGVLNALKEPLDKISGGRGQQILAFLAMVVVTILAYLFFMVVFRLLAYMFPTTFGYSGASAGASSGAGAAFAAAGGAAAGGQGAPTAPTGVQVEVNVEDDAFFQENDDL